MESMRDLLKRSLGRSLGGLSEADRVNAAWPVACGKALAERAEIVAFAAGVVHVAVAEGVWMEQMLSMRAVLASDLARIAGVAVREIHFRERKRPKEQQR